MKICWKILSVLTGAGLLLAAISFFSKNNLIQPLDIQKSEGEGIEKIQNPTFKPVMTENKGKVIEGGRGEKGKSDTKEQSLVNKWKAIYNNPIDFWGKVIDQNGNPISRARVEVTVYNDPSWSFDGRSLKDIRASDSKGRFEILGVKGEGVAVKASAQGYVSLFDERQGDLSFRKISYARQSSEKYNRHPTKDTPAVLVLRKKAAPALLSVSSRKFVSIPRDGSLQLIELKESGGKKGMVVEVRLESESPEPFSYDPYYWQFKFRVSGGEVQPRTDPNRFEAPPDGYFPKWDIEMLKTTGRSWRRSNPSETRDYWVKFGNGDFGRLNVSVSTGRRHTVSIDSWYNLEGSRNLEYDSREAKVNVAR